MGCGASAQNQYESNNREGMGTSLDDLGAVVQKKGKVSFSHKSSSSTAKASVPPEDCSGRQECPTQKLLLDRTHDGKVDTLIADTRHDHHYDTMMTDTTGDGKMDKILIDTTKDGKVDTIEFDTTGDGKADLVEKDTTGDGKVDQVFKDNSGDGRADMLQWDTNGTGHFNRTELDTTGDGKRDVIQLDTNGDGKVDFRISITGPQEARLDDSMLASMSLQSLRETKTDGTSPKSKQSLDDLDEARPSG